jgi:hypothetical protein
VTRIKFEWEAIDSQTLRAKVLGGWLVRYHSHSGAVSMTLVPDPEHKWAVEIPSTQLSRSRERLAKLEHDVKDPYLEANIKGEVEEEIENLRRFINQHGL